MDSNENYHATVLILGVVAIFHKHLKISYKARLILFAISLFIFSEITLLGMYSNNKTLLIQGGASGLESMLSNYSPGNVEDVNTLLSAIQEGVIRVTSIVSSLNHFSRQKDSKKDLCNTHQIIDNYIITLRNKSQNRN